MSELTLTALRLGLLVALWAFVLAVVGVLRADLFGTRVSPRPTEPPAPRPSRRERREQREEQPRAGRTLVVVEGSLRGTTLALDRSPVLIGRGDDCTLVLDDEYASTRHVRISPAGDGWVVEDLQSTNGTYLGRERLTVPVPFEPGVPLRIGRTVLELRR